ncbi:hypothetical protein GJ633_02555 [Halorubrum sp. CBA1125]|uniref:hypothetical protein n=1 Tax=Halorubrum sp. CBA1125 TaxID=2668072 RepID=UPI0012E7A57E|nr:hypothetical protein [Halorubrum sp. CBA1125]MUW13661.1 hypothetical protein [Halorubrum sp. CBA1125]
MPGTDRRLTLRRLTPAVDVLARTRAALGVARTRRDSRLVLVGAGLTYLVAYLFTVGDLALGGGSGVTVRVADDLSRAFASLGFFRFGAIAVISAGPITYLFSPLNALLAIALAALVGANLALTYLGLVQPRACGLEGSTGVIAGIPALLSGAACCGPTILLVIGVQASATIVTGFQLMVPVAFAMLVGSLLLVGRKVDPTLL